MDKQTTGAEPVSATWTRRGSLHGGTVAAIAASPAWDEDRSFFAATMAGLFRSEDDGVSWKRAAEGLTGLSLSGLAVSPKWADDHTLLVASIDGNIFRVVFGAEGPRWTAANLRGRQVSVSALAISPAFNRDGMAFAATMGDGVLRTRDRGMSWDAWNFGLLDLEVLALAISPSFAEDETLFAATATGIFRSPNAGRAWRELQFPDDVGAVLCLAISPDFAKDETIFAGTEEGAIFRSTDGGRRWKPLHTTFEGEYLNALQLSPRWTTDQTLVAVTEAAVYVSTDAGGHWTQTASTVGAMSLALPPTDAHDAAVMIGLAQDGVLRATGGLSNFAPANDGLAGRLLVGLAASSRVGQDGLLATWGPSEGIFVSRDGGTSWEDRAASLPSLEVNDVAIAGSGSEAMLFAALAEGIFGAAGDGEWQRLADIAAHQVRLSPTFAEDGTLFAATRQQGLWTSTDRGATWSAVEGFSPTHEILAVAVSPRFRDDRALFVAARDRDGSVALISGNGAGWRLLASHPASAVGAVVTCILDGDQTRWFAALDAVVYGPLGGSGASSSPVGEDEPRIVALASDATTLYAATEHGLRISGDLGGSWRAVDGEPARSIVAVAPLSDGVWCLGLGGDIWSVRLDT